MNRAAGLIAAVLAAVAKMAAILLWIHCGEWIKTRLRVSMLQRLRKAANAGGRSFSLLAPTDQRVALPSERLQYYAPDDGYLFYSRKRTVRDLMALLP